MNPDEANALLLKVLGTAESALGTTYKFGGNSLSNGVDCSGLVQQAYKSIGITLPRVSADQAKIGWELQGLAQARPGDLLSWDNSGRNVGADHIAIYLGDGKMLAASSGNGKVVVQPVYGSPRVNRVVGAVPVGTPKKVALGPNTSRSYTEAAIARAPVPEPTAPASPGDSENGEPAMAAAATKDDKPTPRSSPAEVEAYIRKHYPDVAPFLANPEIRKVLFDAALSPVEISAGEIAHRFRQTDYWQTHGAASQSFDKLLAEHPADAVTLVENASNTVADLFAQNGIPADEKKIGEVAKNAIRAGWLNSAGMVANAAKLNDFLVFLQKPNAGNLPSGAASVSADGLGTIAHDYMVPVTRHDLENAALDIQSGRLTEDMFRQRMAQAASSMFEADPGLVKQIAAGQTPFALFAPQRAAIGKFFEVDPQTVDLTDSRWADVMQMHDGTTRRPMTYGETVKWAMQNAPKNTQWYQQQDAEVSTALLEGLGKVA